MRRQALVNVALAAATHANLAPVALEDMLHDKFLYLL